MGVLTLDKVESIAQDMELNPKIHFLDGNQLSGREAWNKAILCMGQAIKEAANLNAIVVRRLPWLCCECGKEGIKSLRMSESDTSTFLAKCDECGEEYYT